MRNLAPLVLGLSMVIGDLLSLSPGVHAQTVQKVPQDYRDLLYPETPPEGDFSYDLYPEPLEWDGSGSVEDYFQVAPHLSPPTSTSRTDSKEVQKKASPHLFLRENPTDQRVRQVLTRVREDRSARTGLESEAVRFLRDLQTRSDQSPEELSGAGSDEVGSGESSEPLERDWQERLVTRNPGSTDKPESSGRASQTETVEPVEVRVGQEIVIPGTRRIESGLRSRQTGGFVEEEETEEPQTPLMTGYSLPRQDPDPDQERNPRVPGEDEKSLGGPESESGLRTPIRAGAVKEERVPYNSKVRSRLLEDRERELRTGAAGNRNLSSQQLRSQGLGGTTVDPNAPAGATGISPIQSSPASRFQTGPRYYKNTTGDVRRPDYTYRFEGVRRYSVGEREYGNQSSYQGLPYYRRQQ